MKKALIITLAILIFLLPTITALIICVLPDDLINTPVNTSGTLSDESATYEFNKNKNAVLAEFFDKLYESSSLSDKSIDQISYNKKYLATILQRSNEKHIELYVSLDNGSYFSEGSMLYEISKEHANEFLCSEFAIGVYEALFTPELITFSNEAIIPSSSSFRYVLMDGRDIAGKHSTVTNDTETYYSSDTRSISFSNMPITSSVRAYVDDILVFEGTIDGLKNSNIDPKQTVRYEIDALWEQNDNVNCFGSAHYDFYVEYAPIASFWILNKSVEAGEFIVVKASNIIDVEKIEYSLAFELDFAPVFFKNGDYHYALIPVSVDLEDGSYDLSLSYGETSLQTRINVTKRNRTESSTTYTVNNPLTQQDLDDMNALISSIGLKCTDELYARGSFVNYEESYSNLFYLKLGFGRVRPVENSLPFDMIGIEFSATSDINIPVINSGVVCASGEDRVLGKYVVIDHGYGLKSWYCNISEALVSVGDMVEKGDAIAKTGSSAFYSQSGFYLITTVLGTPVSPYAIYEKNFVLPQ